MSAVHWGSNTVHSIGAAPAPASFGFNPAATPSPAPAAFGFNTSTTPSPAAAPAAFGFNAAVAPSPAPSAFGFNTATAPSPAPAAFGFNTATTTSNPGQQIPAQAAIQAKISAERVVENERIKNRLEKLYRIYHGTLAVPEDAETSAKFCTIIYNDLTPEEIQVRMIHGMTTGYPQQQQLRQHNNMQQQQSIFRPPRPNQICGKDWDNALISNPDPNKYVATPIIGAIALQARVSNQQQRANEYAKNAAELKENLEFIRQREQLARQDLIEKDRQYAHMNRRLLELMKKVEVARCLNQPFQPDEHRCFQQLMELLTLVKRMRGAFGALQNQAKTQIVNVNKTGGSYTNVNSNDVLGVDKKNLISVLIEQRRKLEVMTDTAKTDLRDLDLIANRVASYHEI